MDSQIPYDYLVVFLLAYDNQPTWIPPPQRVYHPDYNNELTQFLPQIVTLKNTHELSWDLTSQEKRAPSRHLHLQGD